MPVPEHTTLYQKLLDERAPAKRAAKPQPASALPTVADAELRVIAHWIGEDPAYAPCRWCAEPYRAAMLALRDIGDQYGADSGASVVAYLVGNLAQYRGPRARQIKAELRRRLKHA